MLPSSLVFVALIAVWVISVVIAGLRRREHLTTARSVDRFSTHMRVLQRRAVKTAPAVTAASTTTLTRPVEAPVTTGTPADAVPAARLATSSTGGRVGARSTRLLAGKALAAKSFAAKSFSGETFSAKDAAPRAFATRTIAPEVLVAALAGSLLVLVGTVIAAAFGALRWGWVAGAAALLVAVVAAARAQAQARRAGRDRRGEARRHQADRAAARARDEALAARPSAPAMPVAQEHVVEPVGVSAAVVIPEPVAAVEVADEPFDLMADPDGWEPQPVPPPTYTLKARAERPLPEALTPPPAPESVDVDDVYDAWDAAMDRAVGH